MGKKTKKNYSAAADAHSVDGIFFIDTEPTPVRKVDTASNGNTEQALNIDNLAHLSSNSVVKVPKKDGEVKGSRNQTSNWDKPRYYAENNGNAVANVGAAPDATTKSKKQHGENKSEAAVLNNSIEKRQKKRKLDDNSNADLSPKKKQKSKGKDRQQGHGKHFERQISEANQVTLQLTTDFPFDEQRAGSQSTDPQASTQKKQKLKGNQQKPVKNVKPKKPREPTLLALQPLSQSPFESQSIGLQPTDLQITYFSDQQKRALPKHSDLELEALRIDESWLLNVTGNSMRGDLGAWLNKQPQVLPNIVEKLKSPTESLGAPIVVAVSANALRVLELIKQVKPLMPEPNVSGGIAKLFARHQPLSKHVKMLSQHPISFALCTPDRVAKLMMEDALRLDRLEWIILDVTWQDSKQYSLLDTSDQGIKEALWKHFFGFEGLRNRLISGKTRIVAF